MNRRELMSFAAALAGLAIMPEAESQTDQQITHVDTKPGGPVLQSSVVKLDSLHPEGAAPGAKAYVHFNGPTGQLSALACGLVTLEPGAQPHPPHRHPEEEIMIVGEGSGEFSINGSVTPVKTGDILFVESDVLHGVRNTSRSRMIFYFIKMASKTTS